MYNRNVRLLWRPCERSCFPCSAAAFRSWPPTTLPCSPSWWKVSVKAWPTPLREVFKSSKKLAWVPANSRHNTITAFMVWYSVGKVNFYSAEFVTLNKKNLNVIEVTAFSFLCRLRGIAEHRDNFLFGVCLCVRLSGSHTVLAVMIFLVVTHYALMYSLECCHSGLCYRTECLVLNF